MRADALRQPHSLSHRMLYRSLVPHPSSMQGKHPGLARASKSIGCAAHKARASHPGRATPERERREKKKRKKNFFYFFFFFSTQTFVGGRRCDAVASMRQKKKKLFFFSPLAQKHRIDKASRLVLSCIGCFRRCQAPAFLSCARESIEKKKKTFFFLPLQDASEAFTALIDRQKWMRCLSRMRQKHFLFCIFPREASLIDASSFRYK